jgi:uncharacterized repeat protein (TIGR01451 family)
VPAGATLTLTLTATVVGPAAQTNTATVTDSDQLDPDPDNNTGSVGITPVLPPPVGADLQLVKTADRTTVTRNEVVTFGFVLRNGGPGAATDVMVSDPFPAGLNFVGVVSIDQGVYDPATGVWRVGTLANGATVTLRVAALVTAVGTLNNLAVASGAEFDPDLSNSRSVVTLTMLSTNPSKRDLLTSTPAVLVATPPTRVGDPSIRGFGVPGLIAVGAGAGDRPLVRVFDQATGAERFRFHAYDPAFLGGVAVAVGDVNGDGVADVVTAAGPGGAPHVEVFNGRTGALLFSFFAYDPAFRGGVTVASGDVNGDGFADIITGAGAGGLPHVMVFDGRTGAALASFLAYAAAFRGGITVAAGDVNGDGRGDIITGSGPGAVPHVMAFDLGTGAALVSFHAYGAAFLGGVFVGATGPAGGRADIVTGPGPGAGAHVKRFDGRTGAELASFMAADLSGTGGARVAGADVTGSRAGDILVGAGPGQNARLVRFDGRDLSVIDDILALDSDYQGGVFVGAGR